MGGGAPAEHRRYATLLVADVVGFSTLAERLAQHVGNAGAEVLSARLNACLAPVVDGILDHGGDVLGFAGDAVIAAWVGDDAPGRAAACASALPREVRPPEGEPLALRVASAHGEIVEDLVGGDAGEWVYLVRGDVFTAVKAALAHGAPPTGGAPSVSGRLATPAPTDPALLGPFVPPFLLERLDGGAMDWVAEMRRATVLFAGLGGLAGAEATLERVQAVTVALQTAVHAAEGVVLQLMVDDKGAVLLAAWDLPGATHEDDATRGVLAALRIREALATLDVPCTVGVATGRVFCGLRGSRRRREYGVMGAVVNLAARLMGAAEGVLCDEVKLREAGTRVVFGEVREIAVKGREEPVRVGEPSAVGGRAAREASALLGRTEEREAFAELLEGAAQGRGAAMVLCGDAGIGKSALLRTLSEIAAARGARWIGGWGDALESTTSYFAWRPVVAALLDVTGDVVAGVARCGLDPGMAPLLAPMLMTSMTETAETRALVGSARPESTARLLAGLLTASAREGLLVLAIDDAHWLDSASWLALQRLSADLPPLLLVVATRPTDEEPLRALERAARVLPLGPLGATELRQILAGKLGVGDVDDVLLAAVDARAEGNPYHAEEIALALRESGRVRVVDGVARLARGGDTLEGLPASLAGIVTGRIDRLPSSVQTTLKAASVAGASFHRDLLAAIHPARPDADTLAAHLDALVRGNLTELDAVSPGTWRFRHRVVQEAAYGLLVGEQRRTLHRAVAEEVERLHADALAPHLGLLAEHWARTGDAPRAVDALERAGEQAHGTYANVEAVGFLERAIEHAGPAPSPIRKLGWLRRLGEARLGLGDLGHARLHAEEALACFGRPIPSGRAARAWALLTAAAEQARHQLRPMRRALPPPPEEARTLREAALAYGLVSTTGFWNADVWALVFGTVAGTNLTELLPPSNTRAVGYAGMGLVLGAVPLHRLAESYGLRAIAVAEETRDADATAYGHMMVGIYYTGAGRLEVARTHVEEAAARYRKLGHARRVEECLSMFCADRWFREDLDGLSEFADELYASALRRDDAQNAAAGLSMRAMLAGRRGDLDGAWALWQRVRFEEPDRLNRLFLHGQLADLALRRGDPVRARTEAVATAAILRASSTIAPTLFDPVLLAGRTFARLGALRDARAVLVAMRRHARVYPLWGSPRGVLEAEVARAAGAEVRAHRLFARARADATSMGLLSVAAQTV